MGCFFAAIIFLFTTSSIYASPGPNSFFILTETMNSGLGAELSAVLGALYKYEKGDFAGLEINLNSGFYFDPAIGPNWWNYYFAPISLGPKDLKPEYYSSVD